MYLGTPLSVEAGTAGRSFEKVQKIYRMKCALDADRTVTTW